MNNDLLLIIGELTYENRVLQKDIRIAVAQRDSLAVELEQLKKQAKKTTPKKRGGK